jgi:hypothetical protein
MINKIQIETDFLTLMEIAQKTGNPELAIALLSGTYQQPEFDTSDRVRETKTSDKEPVRERLIFKSYNNWEDQVSYIKENSTWLSQMSRYDWELKEIYCESEPIANLHELTHENH